MMLTILEGSTFCICDELGDVGEETSGFFADDTRFLSKLALTINGMTPLPLSSGKVEYFSAAFYLRNPLSGSLQQDQLSIRRERFVGEGMQDVVVLENQSMNPLELELGLAFASDFADILSVKAHDFALGDPLRAKPLPDPAPCRYDEEHNQFVFADPGDSLRTQIILSQHGTVNGSSVSYAIELAPRERWEVRIDVVPIAEGDELVPRAVERRFGEERGRVRDSLAAWQLRVPQLRADWDELSHSFSQSVSDLASLRMRGSSGADLGKLPAAGMPWFMTVFGRDTVITCMQTLLFGPELARSALDVLASLQATEDDPSIDAEPGKIVHEVRQGKAAKAWFSRYYGTLDATPLYLVLLSEVWRWTDDVALAARLQGAGAGGAEVDRRVRRPRRRRLRRVPQARAARARRPVVEGLVRLAALPRRSHRAVADRAVRGAGLRLRREAPHGGDRARGLARPRARRPARPGGRGAEAAVRRGVLGRGARRLLRARARRRQEARRLDVLEHRPPALVADRSGRAGGRDRRPADGRRPLVGVGRPHDVGGRGRLQPAQLPQRHRLAARQFLDRDGPRAVRALAGGAADRPAHARRVASLQLPAARGLRGAAPLGDAVPDRVPDRGAAAGVGRGTPVLLLQVLLGLQPDRRRHVLESLAPLELPHWAGSIRLSGVRAFDSTWDVRVENGTVKVESV